MKRQMHLNLFIHCRGHHEAAWRHPAASPLSLSDIQYYQELAQQAEAGLFDSIFLADQLALGADIAHSPRHGARARRSTIGACREHQPYRPDRHLVNHLQ